MNLSSFFGSSLQPDFSLMFIDDMLGDSETEPGPLYGFVGSIPAVEFFEGVVGLFRSHPDALITNGQTIAFVRNLTSNGNRGVLFRKLNGIAEQVFHDLSDFV